MNLFQQREQQVGLIAEANGLTYETTGKKQASKGRGTVRRAFANDKIPEKKKGSSIDKVIIPSSYFNVLPIRASGCGILM